MTQAKDDAAAFRTAARIQNIGVSTILQIGARATALQAQGRPVIVLAAGEPDFDTPDNVKAAAIGAIEAGDTHYTALDGTPDLKRAIQQKFARENNLHFELDEITVATGAKQVLFNAFMATLQADDEVIIPAPYWTSYEDAVGICDARVVPVPCSAANGFLLQARDLEQAITPHTRWLLLNSPGNPTGAVYSRDDYQQILAVLQHHPDVWLLADDIYEHIVHDDFEFATPAQVAPELRPRILTVNGVSKAYAMTGWRIGYAAGPKAMIKAMAVVQSQATSCPSSISQAAAVAALNGPQEFLKGRQQSFEVRRDLVVQALNRIDGIECQSPRGAFYTFASCQGVLNRKTPTGEVISSDTEFCKLLLEQADVAVVPGSAFGLSPFFRISYATSEAELIEALDRIASFVAQLSD